jgi:hypothetical protein
MTDIQIDSDKMAKFLKMDSEWRSQLVPAALALLSEYQMVWLPLRVRAETRWKPEKAPKLPVRVHDEFVDFLNECGFPYEII